MPWRLHSLTVLWLLDPWAARTPSVMLLLLELPWWKPTSELSAQTTTNVSRSTSAMPTTNALLILDLRAFSANWGRKYHFVFSNSTFCLTTLCGLVFSLSHNVFEHLYYLIMSAEFVTRPLILSFPVMQRASFWKGNLVVPSRSSTRQGVAVAPVSTAVKCISSATKSKHIPHNLLVTKSFGFANTSIEKSTANYLQQECNI